MPNSYDVNQINLLVTQLSLKRNLKPGDSIYLDAKYLTQIETHLKNHNIQYEIFPMSGAYQIIIKKVIE